MILINAILSSHTCYAEMARIAGSLATHTHLGFLFRVDDTLFCKAHKGWRVLETFRFFRGPAERVGAVGRVQDGKGPGQRGKD